MKYIGHTTPKMLIADEGKRLRAINDIYRAKYLDELGNEVEEHIPYYTTVVFLADEINSLLECEELYVEEV